LLDEIAKDHKSRRHSLEVGRETKLEQQQRNIQLLKEEVSIANSEVRKLRDSNVQTQLSRELQRLEHLSVEDQNNEKLSMLISEVKLMMEQREQLDLATKELLNRTARHTNTIVRGNEIV
jgi:predicted membrane chloride channel (bestrophin family)